MQGVFVLAEKLWAISNSDLDFLSYLIFIEDVQNEHLNRYFL